MPGLHPLVPQHIWMGRCEPATPLSDWRRRVSTDTPHGTRRIRDGRSTSLCRRTQDGCVRFASALSRNAERGGVCFQCCPSGAGRPRRGSASRFSGLPWAREAGVFFGRPKLRQRDVAAGPMYRVNVHGEMECIDHVCRRRQLNREVVGNLRCQARLAKARPSARSWGRETLIVNVNLAESPRSPRESQGQGCLVRGGLHNFPVDLSTFRGGSPLPGSVAGGCGARFRRFCVFPAPVCHGAGTLNCSRRKRFQNQSLLGSWAKHTCFARKNLSGATLWGVAPHPLKHQVGEGEREREGVRVVSR